METMGRIQGQARFFFFKFIVSSWFDLLLFLLQDCNSRLNMNLETEPQAT